MASSSSEGDELLSQINVTPLVDVLLVLLLVLMVSASAAVARSLGVNLPKAESGVSSDSPLIVSVAPDGSWHLADRIVSAAELRAHLNGLGDTAALSVVVAADGSVSHRHVVQLLDVLQLQGVFRVAFAVSAEGRSR